MSRTNIEIDHALIAVAALPVGEEALASLFAGGRVAARAPVAQAITFDVNSGLRYVW